MEPDFGEQFFLALACVFSALDVFCSVWQKEGMNPVTFSVEEKLYWMRTALEQAQDAMHEGEVPVGAVILDPSGGLVSKAHNTKEASKDPCAHAELLAIKKACHRIGNWRLEGHVVFVTLEPCPMCLSAMQQARIRAVFFGAYDPKGGALSLGFNLHRNAQLNHSFETHGGLLHHECADLLSTFFRQRRSWYKKSGKTL